MIIKWQYKREENKTRTKQKLKQIYFNVPGELWVFVLEVLEAHSEEVVPVVQEKCLQKNNMIVLQFFNLIIYIIQITN